MRLLLLAVIATAITAVNSESHEDYLRIKEAMRAWPQGASGAYLEHRQVNRYPVEDSMSRSKRSIFEGGSQYLASEKACQTPGYTGEFCETPICSVNNPNVQDNPDTDGTGATFDTANLANCTEKYVILVDETQFNIRIELEAYQPVNPQFVLVAEDGAVKLPDFAKIERNEYMYNAEWVSLPPGRYVVTPSADLMSSYCYMIARANTALNIAGGFVNQEGMQPERSDFPDTRFVYKDQLAVGVFHGNSLRSPAKLVSVTFLGQSNLAYRANLLKTRYNCSYEYIYESFLCRQTGNFLYMIEGVTFQGYGFRRVLPFSCANAPATTTQPPSPTTPIATCQNNGMQIFNSDGTFYCYCVGLWSGADCSQKICLNGGTLNQNQCDCPIGYDGEHCQNVRCSNNGQLGFDTNHPTLTIVLRIRNQMNNVVQQFVNATEAIFNDLQFDPTYLNNFILVAFNNDQLLLSQQYSDFPTFKSDLEGVMASQNSSGNCYDSLFGAIGSALDRYPTVKSPVYILTDAPPDDLSLTDTVLYQTSLYRTPLHVVFVKPDPTCALTIEDGAYRALDMVAKKSGGEVFSVTDRTIVQSLVYNHMKTTLYKSRLMLSNNFDVCSNQNNYQSVAVDYTTDTLTIVATGSNLQLVVQIPEGPFFNATLVFNSGNNYIWMVNGPHAGNWFFSLVSQSAGTPCGMKVYQKSFNNIAAASTQYDLFWSFTTSIDNDALFHQPLYGFPQSIVAHLTGNLQNPTQFDTAAMNIYAIRNGKQNMVYASNGIFRDGCSYHYYFPDFTCQVPNEMLYFNFFVQDDRGMGIQRAGSMYCAQITPTISPPSSCVNGGVMNPANNSCFCPPGYAGTHCENLVCYNGGSPAGPSCACVPGWTGTFCTIPQCLTQGPTPEYFMKYVDMIFAVELTQVGVSQVAQLNKYFSEILRDVQSQDPAWIRRFVLVGFNSTWSDVLYVAPATEPSGIIDALNNITVSTFTDPNTDKNCGVQMFQALDKAVLQRDAAPGSFIELFFSSTPDNSNPNAWNALYEFSRRGRLRITAFQGVSSRNPNQYYCNGTDNDFMGINQLTGSSSSQTYQVQNGNIGNIVRVIPLQYFNGMVYTRFEMDCSYPIQMYFPVDSYAQTIQFDTWGQNINLDVHSSDGTTFTTTELVRDTVSQWMIAEVRKPCDDGWVQSGQYCFQFNTDHLNHADARAFCHASKGQLVDDLTDSKHAFVGGLVGPYSIWLGLYSDGTKWVWDRPDGSDPLPLNQADTFWADGVTPDPTNVNNTCVYWYGPKSTSTGLTWYASPCDPVRFFLCQKHIYDQDYVPEPQGDIMPAGKWYVNVTTTPNTVNPNRECFVTVRVQSQLQIVTGYTTKMTDDLPQNDPLRDSHTNQLMTYIHSLDNENRDPVMLSAMLNDAYNATFYNAANYQYRLGCSFPWISQTFSCPNPQNDNNEFSVTHVGEDVFGQMFQRITYGHCSREPLTCGNGGYRYQGDCVCDEYWQGRLCTIPNCVNNGTLNVTSNQCVCPTGFTGFACQYEMCDRFIPSTFTPNSKTLILMVELTQRNQEAVNQLATGLAGVISTTTSQYPTYFTNYELITFNSSGVISIMDFFEVNEVVAALTAAAQQITDPGQCTMPLYLVMGTFLRSEYLYYVQWPASEMLVVTASGASDAAAWHADMATLADYKIIVHYLYQSSDLCGETPQDGSLSNIVRVAYTTDGNVAFMKSANLISFLTSYLPTRYAVNVLSNPTYHLSFACAGNDWYVQVDKNTTTVFVSTTALYGSLGVLDPTGQMIPSTVLYNQDSTKLYSFGTNGISGIYKLNFVSPGDCYASVYAVGGPQVYAQYAVATPTNPSGSRQDGSSHSPTAYVNNVATVHLTGMPSHMGRLQYIEIYDVDTQQTLIRSELYLRKACTYEYVSDPFTCSSDLLVTFIYGMDEYNSQFRRQSVAYCLNKTQATTSTRMPTSPTTTRLIPTTTGPTTTTPVPTTSYSNLNLRFDLVFLVDVSQSAFALYDDMAKFIQTLMLSYTVSTANAHVGIIPVFGDSSYGPMVVAQLNTITSQSVLISYLNELKLDYADFDDQGQYLQQALSTAMNPNFITLSNGYRPISNHLLIYVTATSTFSDAPSSASILTNNAYGIITVGYGAGITTPANLQAIAGGPNCAFTAVDFNSLNRQVLPGIQNLIWAADGNGGKYCGN